MRVEGKFLLFAIMFLFLINPIDSSIGLVSQYSNCEIYGNCPVFKSPSFYMPTNKSVFGSYDFNNGCFDGGVSIFNGTICAEVGLFLNISTLNVTQQNLTILDDLILNGFTTGSVLFIGSNGEIKENNSKFFRDDANNRLGLGTATPLATLHINGGVGSLSTGITFGDGDTGVFENPDDTLTWRFNNANSFSFSSSALQSSTNGAFRLATSSSISYTFKGDTNTGIDWNSADNISLVTGGKQALTIDSLQKVGINTTTPQNTFNVIGDGNFTGNFTVDETTLFVDSVSNRVGIGTTNPVAPLEIQSLAASMRQTRYSDTGVQSAGLTVQRSGGTTVGTDVIVQDGWRIANFNLRGYDGGTYRTAASIQAHIDGTPGVGDMPGRLTFFTTADGSSSATERMRIDSSGRVGIGTSTPQNTLNVIGDGNFTGNTTSQVDFCIEGGNCLSAILGSGEANSTAWNRSGTNVFLANIGDFVGIGTVSPTVGLHGVVTNGKFLWADAEADNTNKLGRWGVQHYDTDEEDFYGIIHATSSGSNNLFLGGGSGFGNAATNINLVTAENSTTTTGTTRMVINSGGNVGIGTTAPQNTLNVIGDGNVTGNLSLGLGTFFLNSISGKIGIGMITDLLDTFNVNGSIDLKHTATFSDDHAFEIDLNANGFGDVKAINIDFITGAIGIGQDEEAILINVDQFLATGGTVIGLEVITTEGLADIYGLEVGALVNPILQLSGEFSNESSATVSGVDKLSEFLSPSFNTSIFVSDDDNITIGSTSKFEEIEFILSTVSSGSGISPTFEFSTGIGTWTTFNPTDGTNAFRNNGVVLWLDEDIPSWNTSSGEYLIKITRTKNSLATNPIANLVRIVSGAIEFKWDKNGDIFVNEISANALSGTYSNGEAFVCVWDNGTIFAKDSMCS